MMAFPAVSLPGVRQGSCFPCRPTYHCEKQAVQAVDRERLYAAAEVFFSPGGEIFPCCFPRGREKC